MGAQAGKFDLTHLSGVTCLAVEGNGGEVYLLTEDRHGRHSDIAEWVRLSSSKGGFLMSGLQSFYPHGDTFGVATWSLRPSIETLKPFVPFTIQYPKPSSKGLSVMIQPLYITTSSYENSVPPSRCDGRTDVLEEVLQGLCCDSGFSGTPSEFPGFLLTTPNAKISFEPFSCRRRSFSITHQLPFINISVLSSVGDMIGIQIKDQQGKRHSVWRKHSAFEALRRAHQKSNLPAVPIEKDNCLKLEAWLQTAVKASVSDASLRGLLKMFFGYMSEPLDGFLVQIRKARSDESFGISFNNMTVTRVARGGIAEKCGIKQGMRIHSIGGRIPHSDFDLESFFTVKNDSVNVVCSNTPTQREDSSSESISSLGDTCDDRSLYKRSFFSSTSYAELEECCPTDSDVPVVGSIVLLRGHAKISGQLAIITDVATMQITVRLFCCSGLLGDAYATVNLESVLLTHSSPGTHRREATLYMSRNDLSQGFGFTINTLNDVVSIEPKSVAASCGLSIGQRIISVGFEKVSTRQSILATLSEPSLQICLVIQCQEFELPTQQESSKP